jgi:glycosyltransferase involved in cell wall biosynthesis
MRRVLMVSAHFPPDTNAGAHRVRLLAPHMPQFGWDPTVVTVEPSAYEGRLDPGLLELVPNDLRVVRCGALPARWTRKVGVGDLGLRSLGSLNAACARLLAEDAYDALFITIYPAYSALLGPRLKRRFRIPFVLDYQDPWVGAWGHTVGGGTNGTPDLKSRLTRRAAAFLERRVVPWADAITAVSAGTYQSVLARIPAARDTPCLELPLGSEPADFARVPHGSGRNAHFAADDGLVHVCYVGTLLPLGFETLHAVLEAVAGLRSTEPALFSRLRLHFFGTSNQTTGAPPPRVLHVADALGLRDHVTEWPARVDYLEALAILRDASVVLALGSSEAHYTASRIFPALLSGRPLLAVYHEGSSVRDIVRAAAREGQASVVTYDDRERAASRVDAIRTELVRLATRPDLNDDSAVDPLEVKAFTAREMAGRLAGLLDSLETKHAD